MSKENQVVSVDSSLTTKMLLPSRKGQEDPSKALNKPGRKAWQVDVTRETVLRVVERLKRGDTGKSGKS